MKKFLSLMGLVGVLGFGVTANAQTVGLVHTWTVPGVMNTVSGLSTYIACTNGGTASSTVAVDIYGPTGAFVVGNSSTVGPNATVLFGTTPSASLAVDVAVGPGILSKGHARVLASTTRGLVCSAFLADASTSPPGSMTSLSVVKKFSQKGQ